MNNQNNFILDAIDDPELGERIDMGKREPVLALRHAGGRAARAPR